MTSTPATTERTLPPHCQLTAPHAMIMRITEQSAENGDLKAENAEAAKQRKYAERPPVQVGANAYNDEVVAKVAHNSVLNKKLAMLSNTKTPFRVGWLRAKQNMEAKQQSTRAALTDNVRTLITAENNTSQGACPLNDGGESDLARKGTLLAMRRAFRKMSPKDVAVLLTKTKNGDTQTNERKSIGVIGECFKNEGLSFDSVGPQQPYDFSNIGFEDSRHDLGIRLEHKHTNGNRIMLNDTPPPDHKWTFYAICKSPKKRRRGFVALVPSVALRSGSEAYIRTIEFIIRDVLRAQFAKTTSRGAVTSFPRANYSCNLAALEIEKKATYVRFVGAE